MSRRVSDRGASDSDEPARNETGPSDPGCVDAGWGDVPRGAVRIDVHATVQADPVRFVELAVDLERLVALHPRLLDARWLDAPAAVGSRAEIHVALPAALSLLSAVVGSPRGTLTLVDHHPGRSVRYRLDADRVAGVVELIAGVGDLGTDPSPAAPAVTVLGALWAKSTLARAAMMPTLPLLEPALTAAVGRTIRRADELLRAEAPASGR